MLPVCGKRPRTGSNNKTLLGDVRHNIFSMVENGVVTRHASTPRLVKRVVE
jgi:hypothetical protein